MPTVGFGPVSALVTVGSISKINITRTSFLFILGNVFHEFKLF